MKKNEIKKPKSLILREFSDDWEGCNNLINIMIEHFLNCKNYAEKMAKVKNSVQIGDYIEIVLDENTKINPAFYPLVEDYSSFLGSTTTVQGPFKNLYKILESKDKQKKVIRDYKKEVELMSTLFFQNTKTRELSQLIHLIQKVDLGLIINKYMP